MSSPKGLINTLIHKKELLFLSLLLGVNLAFYFSAYLKTDFIPLGSTRFLAFTLFLSGVGSLLYFYALLWAEKALAIFSPKETLRTILLSFFLGILLFFTTTSQWLEPEFYVRSVLPISYELFVPWYASTGMAYFVGAVFFATLVFFLFVLTIPKKTKILNELNEKLTPAPFSFPTKQDWLILFSFVLIAFILRVLNLEALPPHLEEYQHLNAAKDLLAGAPKEDVYQRGFYLVTLPVKFFFSIFGVKLWAARLPGVLVNSLAIIPLFLLTRRFNKSVAILSIILYTTSPWVIALSRAVREYAYYPLLFYLILGSVLYLLESIPKGFLLSEWKTIFAKRNLPSIAVLVFFVIYVLFIDPFSTFKVISLLYGVFFFFLIARLDFKDRKNRTFFLGFGVVVLFAVGIFALLLTRPAFAQTFGNPLRALSAGDIFRNFKNGNAILLFKQFFIDPRTQLYYARILLFPLLSILFVFLWGWSNRNNTTFPWFLTILYTFSLGAFVFLYNFIYAPRFFLHIQLWFIPLLAIGIVGWYLALKALVKDRKIRYTLFILIALGTINFQQLTTHLYGDELPVSYAIHMGFTELDEYMRENAAPQDILLAKYYARYARFYAQPLFANIYETSFDQDLIKENSSGWIVVDESRYWAYRKKLLQKNFYLDEIKIEYKGEFPDPISGLSNYVWYWDNAP